MSVLHRPRKTYQRIVPTNVLLGSGIPLTTPTAAEDAFVFGDSSYRNRLQLNQVPNILSKIKNVSDTGVFDEEVSGTTCSAFSNPVESVQEVFRINPNDATHNSFPNVRNLERSTFGGRRGKESPLDETEPSKDVRFVCNGNETYIFATKEDKHTNFRDESWPGLPGSESSSFNRWDSPLRDCEDDEGDGRAPWLKAVRPNCSERLAKAKWPSLFEAGTKDPKLQEKASFSATSRGIYRKSTLSLDIKRLTLSCEQLESKESSSSFYGRKHFSKQKLILRSVLEADSRLKRCRGQFSGPNDAETFCKKDGMFNREEQELTFGPQSMPAVLLMLNTDFVVASPLKENLLLTLALAQKTPGDSDSEAGFSKCQVARKVLVGQFIAFSSFLRFGLGNDAKRVATESNAGGTSTISESLSVEYFVRRFQARDVVTEMEIEYCSLNWKKVDYICNLYGQQVGVSVTRAMSYPNPKDFSPQMACRLLFKKLYGLVVARHGVTKRHSFSHCILHIWCETQETAKIMEAEYKEVAEELDVTDYVSIILTVAEGWHARSIFYESCLEK